MIRVPGEQVDALVRDFLLTPAFAVLDENLRARDKLAFLLRHAELLSLDLDQIVFGEVRAGLGGGGAPLRGRAAPPTHLGTQSNPDPRQVCT
jgi:hypothetical protein